MLKSRLLHINLFLCVFFSCITYSQVVQKKTPIREVLQLLTQEHKVQFNYQSDLLNDVYVFLPKNNLTFSQKIKNLESQTSLYFSVISNKIISIVKTIKICGFIKDKLTNQPLTGATISTENLILISDDTGYFEGKITNSQNNISISFIGYTTNDQKTASFTSSKCKTIFLQQENEVIDPIIITEYLVSGINKTENGNTTINFSTFSILPGLIEADVLQTIQALPGIQSSDETVSNINIRGGSNDQNLILWDDIKMYQSGHFFGLISSFNPQITKKATLITNGTDASYTDGVSGTISMKTDKKITPVFNGNVSVNFISTDLFFDIPLGEKSSLQIAGRKSINNWIQTPTYKVYFDRITQLTEIENNVTNVINSDQTFDFYDTSARWLYHPSKKDVISVNFILINNDLSFNETASFSGNLETKRSSLSQNSIATGISYKRKWNTTFSTILNIYETDYKLKAINANVLQNQRFLQENTVSETGIKLSALYNFENWKLKTGYQLIESKVTDLNDIDLPRFLRLNSSVIREHAIFSQVKYQNKKIGFSISPGLRINYNTKFSKFLLEPRLSIRKKLNDDFQIEALGEFKHQNSTQIINFQNDFLGLEKRRWQLANNNDIPILKSKQASLGLLYSNNNWLVDAKSYYKKVTGITTQSQGFTTKYEFERATGSYSVLGFDFLLRKRIKNISSWLSYSFMNNQYEFNSLEEVQFPSNFDNSHSITLGTTYLNDYLNFSAGFNYRTGKPTSKPLLGNEIITNKVNFDTANNTRLKEYFRVDASAVYKFKISEIFNSEIGVSVWNLLNRENTINNYYRIGSDNSPDKFSRSSLGITTNFVFRLYF